MAVETEEERAAREAEEEEERQREARRQEIRDEISGLEDCRQGVEAQIASLEADRTSLDNSITTWETAERATHNIEIVSEVVITNVFEGVCADGIKQELADCVMQMNQTCSNVEGLSGNVGTQIDRLNEYITVINNEIGALQREYDSL